MKFINSIREGDFVKLKTLEQLESEFGKPQKGGVIGSIFFGDRNKLESVFFISRNVKRELGNVLRIKRVENAELSDEIFFYAENNGISYDYDDIEDVMFEKHIVDLKMRKHVLENQLGDALFIQQTLETHGLML